MHKALNVHQLRLIDLAEKLEALEALEARQFDMGVWIDTNDTYLHQSEAERAICGTVACIAGWAAIESARHRKSASAMLHKTFFGPVDIQRVARAWLGLDKDQGTALFIPVLGYPELHHDRHAAAKVLRHLALTGTVDWSIVETGKET